MLSESNRLILTLPIQPERTTLVMPESERQLQTTHRRALLRLVRLRPCRRLESEISSSIKLRVFVRILEPRPISLIPTLGFS